MEPTTDSSQWVHADARTPSSQKALFRKITWRVMPLVFIAYVFAFLDRVNIGYAKLQMAPELGLSDSQYGLAAGIFFIGYALFEIPSNILLDKVGARKTMTRIMILWGITSAMTMFVTTSQQLYVLRFFLGVFEAGFFPGVILYLSYWYPSYMRGRATATIMIATLVAPIFGGPVSALIMEHFHGVGGWSGWQWLFLLEALPIIIIGFVCFFVLCDRPSQARWLSKDEQALHHQVMQQDMKGLEVSSGSHQDKDALLAAFLDPKVYVLAFLYFSSALGTYTFNFWLPTTIQKMGVTDLTHIALYAMFPFSCAALGMFLVGRSSDLRRERRWHSTFSILFGALMLTLSTLWEDSLVLTLFILGAAAFGFSGAIIVCWAIPSTYLKGKAAPAGIALVSSLGVTCGFVGPALIGFVRDISGKDHAGLYAISLIMVIAAFAMVFLTPKRALHVGSSES
ncbi:major facilitator transporter [Pseudomonas putida]|uniref:Major facilitator transporter n=1 Tax=Pseudomonas putida TaxID=303 RepID=A0A379KQN0_PSEPU|nr:MFS transporter [Pseudomonas putida]SUD69785.1 major facilitator transporter [Pseudomonas putida]